MPVTLALCHTGQHVLTAASGQPRQGQGQHANWTTQHDSSICLNLCYTFHCQAASAPVFLYLGFRCACSVLNECFIQVPDTKVVCPWLGVCLAKRQETLPGKGIPEKDVCYSTSQCAS